MGEISNVFGENIGFVGIEWWLIKWKRSAFADLLDCSDVSPYLCAKFVFDH